MAEDIFTQGYSLISGQALSLKNLRIRRLLRTRKPPPEALAMASTKNFENHRFIKSDDN